MLTKKCKVHFHISNSQPIDFLVNIDENQTPKVAVIQLALEALKWSTSIPSTKKRSLNENALKFFVLRRKNDGKEVVFSSDLAHDDELDFVLDENISPASGSDWDDGMLRKLGIDFEDCAMNGLFPQCPFSLSERSYKLKQTLENLPDSTTKLFKEYETKGMTVEQITVVRNKHNLEDPVWKAVYLLHKYANQESMVDNFVSTLLNKMGFNDEFICVVPQLSMDLQFGRTGKINQRVAKADFVIQDILSFYKMCVIEDKSKVEERTDSQAQMIAEAIANYQQNTIIGVSASTEGTNAVEEPAPSSGGKEVLDELMGVRVNGCRFWFYCIPVTKSIVTAMETMKSVPGTKYTIVRKFGGSNGLDFLNLEDRAKIIEVLDIMKQIVEESGKTSARRQSQLL